MPKQKGKTFDSTPGYLLAEHSRIARMIIYENEMGHNRLQFYISIVSALAAVLVVLMQTTGVDAMFFYLVALCMFGLWFFGATLFIRFIRRSISKVEYLRALAKISRYFVNQDKEIKDYLYWDAYDNTPSFIYEINPTASNLITLVEVSKSVFAALAAASFLKASFFEVSWAHFVLVGALVFIVVMLGAELYRRHMLELAEEYHRKRVDFPSPKGHQDVSRMSFARVSKKEINSDKEVREKKKTVVKPKRRKIKVVRK